MSGVCSDDAECIAVPLSWAEITDVRHSLAVAYEHVDDPERARLDGLDARLSLFQRALPDPFHLEETRS